MSGRAGAGRAGRRRPDEIRRPLFEFCVPGRPVSAQARNRLLLGRWKARVAACARAAWPSHQPPLRDDVALFISQYSEHRISDRDNLIKPIQDALEGIAYRNDAQVKDVTCNWRSIDGMFTVRFLSMPLAVAFSSGEEFLHVRLWATPDMEDLG